MAADFHAAYAAYEGYEDFIEESSQAPAPAARPLVVANVHASACGGGTSPGDVLADTALAWWAPEAEASLRVQFAEPASLRRVTVHWHAGREPAKAALEGQTREAQPDAWCAACERRATDCGHTEGSWTWALEGARDSVTLELLGHAAVRFVDFDGRAVQLAADGGSNPGTQQQQQQSWETDFRAALAAEADARVARLARDFELAATSYGRVILAEQSTPVAHKSIRPVTAELGGIAGGDKYVVMGILFKLAADSHGLFGGDAAAAQKVAGHELRGISMVFNAGVAGVRTPLATVIDHRGFRLLAASQLPIGGARTLAYGSADAGHSVACDADAAACVAELGAALNLAPHRVPGASAELCLPVDAEVHRGAPPGEFYVVDLARMTPPEAGSQPPAKGAHLFRLLRPEFLSAHDEPLSADALSNFGRLDAERHNAAVERASRVLRDELAPRFARWLQGQQSALRPAAYPLGLSVATPLHDFGLNVRLLGRVYLSLTDERWEGVLATEMAARVIKRRVRAEWRLRMALERRPAAEPFKAIALAALNRYCVETPPPLQSDSWAAREAKRVALEEADRAWVGVAREMRAAFDLREEAEDVHRRVARGQLLQRLTQSLGLELEPKAEDVPAAGLPFQLDETQLLAVRPVSKHMGVVDAAEGRQLVARARRLPLGQARELLALAVQRLSRASLRTGRVQRSLARAHLEAALREPPGGGSGERREHFRAARDLAVRADDDALLALVRAASPWQRARAPLAGTDWHCERVLGVDVRADGLLATCSKDETVVVARGAEPLFAWREIREWVRSVRFVAGGAFVVAGGDVDDDRVVAWSVDTGRRALSVAFRGAAVKVNKIEPLGARGFAAAAESGRVFVFADVARPEYATVRAHDKPVMGLAVCEEPGVGVAVAVTASMDRCARVWRLPGWERLGQLDGHEGNVTGAAVSAPLRRIATSSFDATVRLWALDGLQPLAVLRGHLHGVWDVCFAGDGDCLVSGSTDCTLRVWDVELGACVRVLEGGRGDVYAVASAGQWVVSGAADGTVGVVGVSGGMPL